MHETLLLQADKVIEYLVLDQRGQLLRAAIGFSGCSLPSYDRALWALRTSLDSWPGIGHIAVGMTARAMICS